MYLKTNKEIKAAKIINDKKNLIELNKKKEFKNFRSNSVFTLSTKDQNQL